MKKKIKDLTIEEIVKICNTIRKKYGSCFRCPFYELLDNSGLCICSDFKKCLNEKIEVEEDFFSPRNRGRCG